MRTYGNGSNKDNSIFVMECLICIYSEVFAHKAVTNRVNRRVSHRYEVTRKVRNDVYVVLESVLRFQELRVKPDQ